MSSVEDKPRRRRLKRIGVIPEPTQFEIKKARIGQFKFLEDDLDEEDPYTSTSESSYEGGAGEKFHKELGFEDGTLELYNAFVLLKNGKWFEFLNTQAVERILEPARSIIQSCKNANIADNLWCQMWEGILFPLHLNGDQTKFSTCMLCDGTRNLTYSIYDNEDEILSHKGYIGTDCYELKLGVLMSLIYQCKEIAEDLFENEWESDSAEFEKYVLNNIRKAMTKVVEAPEKLQKKYERFYKNN
jgi:hypothetical protein